MMNKHERKSYRWLFVSILVGTSLTLQNCSGNKEKTTEQKAASTGSDSSVFGRQGDTLNSSINGPQQAPPDSGDRGAVVPSEVKVRVKK